MSKDDGGTLTSPKILSRGHPCALALFDSFALTMSTYRTLEVQIMDGIMSNLRNKCEGYRLINRPPTSPYSHNCWWCNEPPTTLKEAKPKKEGISSEVEASPLSAKFDIPPQP